MKKLFFLLFLATFFFGVKSAGAQEKTSWKELDAFHELISKTFHPAEEGKFEPIRARSAEMVEKATAWESSSAPAGYDKNAVKKSLKKLVAAAKGIDNLVKQNASDAVIKEKLSALHDVFHEIVEKCQKEEHM